jgi:hypothetical protein
MPPLYSHPNDSATPYYFHHLICDSIGGASRDPPEIKRGDAPPLSHSPIITGANPNSPPLIWPGPTHKSTVRRLYLRILNKGTHPDELHSFIGIKIRTNREKIYPAISNSRTFPHLVRRRQRSPLADSRPLMQIKNETALRAQTVVLAAPAAGDTPTPLECVRSAAVLLWQLAAAFPAPPLAEPPKPLIRGRVGMRRQQAA